MLNYLRKIDVVWNYIVGDNNELKQHIDTKTVSLLESKLPLLQKDLNEIKTAMEDFTLFPKLESLIERKKILERILSLNCLIPTIHSFFMDLKFLTILSKPMARLAAQRKCLKKVKSIHEAFFDDPLYTEGQVSSSEIGQAEVQFLEQVGENKFKLAKGTTFQMQQSQYWQLWLYVMRHFAEMLDIQPKRNKRSGPKPFYAVRECLYEQLLSLSSKIEIGDASASSSSITTESIVFDPQGLPEPDLDYYLRMGIPCQMTYEASKTMMFLPNLQRGLTYNNSFQVQLNFFDSFFRNPSQLDKFWTVKRTASYAFSDLDNTSPSSERNHSKRRFSIYQEPELSTAKSTINIYHSVPGNAKLRSYRITLIAFAKQLKSFQEHVDWTFKLKTPGGKYFEVDDFRSVATRFGEIEIEWRRRDEKNYIYTVPPVM